MTEDNNRLWEELMASARFQVGIADYTKVSRSWQESSVVPTFNRFYLIEEGEGSIRIEDKVFYPIPRQIVLMPAGVRQGYSTISDNTFRKYWCHFTATLGDLRLFDIMETPYVLTIEDEDHWQHWLFLFRSLKQYMKRDTIAAGFRVNALIMEIMACFIEQIGEVKINRSSAVVDKIHTAITYMEQRFEEQLTIDELAKLVHYHPNYFIQVFKQFTGRSPIQYLNVMRVDKAKQWLSTTDLPVSEIADRVGMTLFYFSRLFKEHSGFTPSGYRQISRK
ncbi:helix-turn-helix transcriptional regulator [Paenibacillus nasutitermitis]|uniref:Transcriptional regulator n=1 Tax=Paenibacillus nasutitermitis TaxID=1652958 RepID=A0A916ZGN3_9BACL|nr:AraC family transcriptional regulator [Paenibacillus nasutitermitis]GGD96821.1 transcriptional regulator [Paenibacillus nasutitermitis]